MRILLIALLLYCNLPLHAQPAVKRAASPDRFYQIDSLIQLKEFDQAIIRIDKMIQNGKSAKNKETVAKAYSRRGNVFLMQRNPDKALQDYFRSLDFYDSKTDTAEISRLYTNIGTLYSILKEFPRAKEYYLKAQQLNHAENVDKLKTTANLAGVYVELKERPSAFKTFISALSLAKKLHNLPLEAVLHTNLSNYFIEEKDWTNAIAHAKASLLIRESLKQPQSVITLNNLGYALVQTGKLEEGISNYHAALKTANVQEKKQLLFNLYNAHKSAGDLPEALQSMEQYNTVKDSIAKLNYEQKVAELTAGYESLKKQDQINQLEKENILQKRQLRQQLFLIIAGVLIVLLISGLVYTRIKHYNIKEALEKSQFKRQLLLLQLNPHFIFNALQSVQRFIYLKDQEQSMNYLNSFSKLIRLVLENSDRDLIPLDEEIEILDNYLRLQNLNNEPAFSYLIETDPAIETENTEIPVMLLQPFVENAVIHGLKDHPSGKILIQFKQESNGLHIYIRDNGQGTPAVSQANNSLHRSMGMDILNQRINEFNKEHPNAIRLTVANRQHPDYPGTSVHLHLHI